MEKENNKKLPDVNLIKEGLFKKFIKEVRNDEKNNPFGIVNDSGAEEDPMYDEIVNFVIDTGKVSASLIQRRFRFGYNRAARIIDLLEARGIIGPPNGSKPREVLYKKAEDSEKENTNN